MIRSLYQLLEIPWVYHVVVRILALGGISYRKKMDKNIFTKPAARVLDVGCGPEPISPEPTGILVGVDINPSYLQTYTGGFVDADPNLIFAPPPGRKRLGYLVSGDSLPFADGSFDEVRTSSFFHHLSDEEAIRSIREMVRCTRLGGRLVMFDAVWPHIAWKRPLAYLILKWDRGRHMRTEQQLVALFQEACPGLWEWERHTYTYTGMELLCLQHVKS
jgi:SAM-dependent methyltransferase